MNDEHISKSQKRHLKKVAKRKEKRAKNREQLEEHREIINKGGTRLIEENSNAGPYTPEFTDQAAEFYYTKLQENIFAASGNTEKFMVSFYQIRGKIQSLVLRWSDNFRRDHRFFYFVKLLTCYRVSGRDKNALWTCAVDPGSETFEKEYSTIWEKIH